MNAAKQALQYRIIRWYATHKRNLPWRKTQDPYKILVSEIMLQQTQVDRVIPKYKEFIKKFPTLQSLAHASPADVLQQWSGLGYNRRAIMLHQTASTITSRFNGKIPENQDELKQFPGIGEYTAAAIASFAFNKPAPCVDTNIRRVLIHECKLSENISRQELIEIARSLIPKNRSRDWHNALMDYGAMIATARKTGITSLSRQKPFMYSHRWYRGQLLKLLIQKKQITIQMAEKRLKKGNPYLKKLAQEMHKEGLVVLAQNTIRLPSQSF